jgi:diguanylate cyclase (GGDEF)-like protein
MSLSKSQTLVSDLAARLKAAEDGRLQPVLVVVQGEELGKRFPLTEKRYILGRDRERATLVVADPVVSGRHALLQVDHEADRYELVDLASRNGTFVNGVRIEGVSLNEGDKIFMGDTVFKFTFHDSIEEDYHSQLDEFMNIDSLTGLYVRRWFDTEFPKAFTKARECDVPLCVLMMDLDGLKAVNDAHGHQMGSYCIAETGKIIKGLVEPLGFGARFGGDEFIAYMLDRSENAGVNLGEQIRQAIEDFDFHQYGARVSPTISVGIASLSSALKSPQELIGLADEALYRAKELGRNAIARRT